MQTRQRRRRSLRCIAVTVVAVFAAGAFAASADASQAVWLDWVTTKAGQTQQWTIHHLNYVETEPDYYAYGCANAQINNEEYFSHWYCSEPGSGYQSAYMYKTWRYAQAWNDSKFEDPLWAWAGYE